MILMRQNDPRWANETMQGKYTLGEYGCLVAALTNVINARNKKSTMTVSDINKLLINRNGYIDGNVVWAAAEQVVGAKIEPWYYLVDERGKEDNYGCIDFRQKNVWYIGRMNTDTGYHFLNILGQCAGYYVMYDTYDDKLRYVPTCDVKRIIKVLST